ncbi:MAG: hypothetical protein QM652_12165 [Legionella sp.]|uniref:hypothetical protein n=1 Tax=Legionella sp. TaxID=459 RepID=UPI0039E62FBB
MNIEQKLALCARPGIITFIQEGMFLRCYQQSLFSLVHYYQPGFKVLGKRIKKLQNLAVFYSGFPVSHIGRFPHARATGWGFELDCDARPEEEYQQWLSHACTWLDKQERSNITQTEALPFEQQKAGSATFLNRQVSLSEEICQFLAHWSPGRYPAAVDSGFIQGLKNDWGL